MSNVGRSSHTKVDKGETLPNTIKHLFFRYVFFYIRTGATYLTVRRRFFNHFFAFPGLANPKRRTRLSNARTSPAYPFTP